MAVSTTEYPTGDNNITYKAKNFVTGLTVTCFIWDPHMKISDEITLTELSNGVYFFAYSFPRHGVFTSVFLENGVEAIFHSFRVTELGILRRN